mgnify:CR=1 FL=1
MRESAQGKKKIFKKKWYAQVTRNFSVIYSKVLLPCLFIVRIEMNALNVPLKVRAEMEITPEWIRISIAWKRRWLIATCVIECYRTVTLSCYWFCWFLNSTHTFLRYSDELNEIYYHILKDYRRNFTLPPINAHYIQRNIRYFNCYCYLSTKFTEVDLSYRLLYRLLLYVSV